MLTRYGRSFYLCFISRNPTNIGRTAKYIAVPEICHLGLQYSYKPTEFDKDNMRRKQSNFGDIQNEKESKYKI